MQADLAAQQQAFNLEKLILEYQLMRSNDSASMVFAQQLAAYVEQLKDAQEAENLEALRQAGLIVSYTLIVENQGGVAIDSASVTVGGNNPVASLNLSTSGGQLVIEDLPVGASPFSITATGYVGVSFIVDFGQVSGGTDAAADEFVVVGERIYPIGRNEASRITLVSVGNGTTATVSGTATIETNVTNLTPEIPQNVTIVAYVDGTSNPYAGHASASGPTIYDFRFIGEGIGSATVDNTTGAWSMVLPAKENGITYSFTIPEITADQTIAIDERDEVAIAPEYAVVPARFGPQSSSTAQTVSSVPGARAVFTAPPAQGSGFTFTFTQVQSGLSTGQNDFLGDEEQLIGNTLYRLTARGSGLSSSPTGTAAGGIATGGSNATFTTAIAGRVTGLSIAAAGTGYAVNDNLTVVVFPRDANGNNTTTDINNDGNNDNNPVNNDGSSLSFTVTVSSVGGGGAITGITLPTTGIGFGADAYFGFGVTQHVVTSVTGGTGVNANFAVSSVNARVSDVQVATGGSLYTSAPTSITFTGGNALGGTPTLPSLTAVVTGFLYNITPSGGTGYSVLPTMSYNYSPSPTATSGDAAVTNVTTFTIIDGANTTTGQAILPEFTLASGVPVLRNSGLLTYRTPLSFSTPVAVITPVPSTLPVATVNISSAAATFGQVTGLSVVNQGRGFASPFTVTIEPSIATAPGSGASIPLTGFGALTANLETQWGGTIGTVVPGSGYLPNLNRSGTVNYSGLSTLTVVSGRTYPGNLIQYGTGTRLQNVD